MLNIWMLKPSVESKVWQIVIVYKSVYYIVQCTIGILSLWYLTNYRMLKYSACKSVLQDELMLMSIIESLL